jgi:DNA-binding PadR family transcriptional regulator
MPTADNISDLGNALLGLLKQQPNSGYGLRKIFDITPMGRYSSSPGAIYPALARLEQQGLIKAKHDKSGSKRPKQIFHVTAKGGRALIKWLCQPVTEEQLVWNTEMLLLRFSFLDLLGDLEFSRRFLADFRGHTHAQIKAVRGLLSSMGDQMPLHGRLALEKGLAVHQANLQWCTSALKSIARQMRSAS